MRATAWGSKVLGMEKSVADHMQAICLFVMRSRYRARVLPISTFDGIEVLYLFRCMYVL